MLYCDSENPSRFFNLLESTQKKLLFFFPLFLGTNGELDCGEEGDPQKNTLGFSIYTIVPLHNGMVLKNPNFGYQQDFIF
jgi:hypothetical protein